MNFDEAIAAHTSWKLKLRTFIKGEGQLDAATVRKDDQCALGQWIYGDGAKHQADPEFQALKSEHAHFHVAAAAVVEQATQGDRLGAETMIGPASDFGKISSRVVASISAIKRKTEGR